MILAFITDITVRKINEKELADQRVKLQEYAADLESKVRERTSELEHMNLGLQTNQFKLIILFDKLYFFLLFKLFFLDPHDLVF